MVMVAHRTARRAFVVLFSITLVAVILWVFSIHLVAALKASMGKRRIADVTAIAVSIECYRAKHGTLPYNRALSEIAERLPRVAAQKSVHIFIEPNTYVVEEAEPGRDARTEPAWRVMNGRWVLWPTYLPADLVPRALVSCRSH